MAHVFAPTPQSQQGLDDSSAASKAQGPKVPRPLVIGVIVVLLLSIGALLFVFATRRTLGVEYYVPGLCSGDARVEVLDSERKVIATVGSPDTSVVTDAYPDKTGIGYDLDACRYEFELAIPKRDVYRIEASATGFGGQRRSSATRSAQELRDGDWQITLGDLPDSLTSGSDDNE